MNNEVIKFEYKIPPTKLVNCFNDPGDFKFYMRLLLIFNVAYCSYSSSVKKAKMLPYFCLEILYMF